MPRAYGITNTAPYASAPAVGAAGDTYWNTTDKSHYASDGTAWVKVGPGGLIPDGSITTAKLADAPSGVTTAKINDAQVTAAKLAAASATRLRAVDALVNPDFDLIASTRILFPSAGAYPGGDVLITVNVGGWASTTDTTQGKLQVQVFLNRPPAAQLLLEQVGLMAQSWAAGAVGQLMPWTYAFNSVASIVAATGLSVEVWTARVGGTVQFRCTRATAMFVGLS